MSTDQVTLASPTEISFSDAYTLMIKGDLEGAIDTLQRNGAPELRNFYTAIDTEIQTNKSEAQEIKDRSFWKRLFSSNTKDLGNTIFEQNTVLSALYVLLRIQSFSGESCSKLLAELYNYADKESSTAGVESSNIQKAIINTLEKNAKEFHLNELRDKALMKLLKAAENASCFENDIRIKLGEAQKAFENSEAIVKKDLEQAKQTYDQNVKSIDERATCFVEKCDAAVKKMEGEFEEEKKDVRRIVDERYKILNEQLIKREKRTRILSILSICIAVTAVVIMIIA